MTRAEQLENYQAAYREQRDFLSTTEITDFTTDESYVKREKVINDLHVWLAADKRLDEQERAFDHTVQTRENRKSATAEDEKEVAIRDLQKYLVTGDRNMIQARANMASNATTTGGYMVPTFISAQVIQDLEALETVRKAGAEVMQIQGNENVPVWADANANFIVEAASITATDPTLARVTLLPQLLVCKTTYSLQLLNRSAANVVENIRKSFVRGIAKKEADKFLNGSGTNEPQGLLVGGTSALTAASATVVTGAEVTDLYYALRPEYAAAGTFVMSAGAASVIRSLQTSNGAFMWVPNLRDGSDQLFGRPVIIDPNMPASTAGLKPIAFADFGSAYVIGEEQNLQVLSDPYSAAGTGEVRLFVYKFVDGRVKKAVAAQYITMHA